MVIMTKNEASKLRIVFMGTPDFAVGSLRALVERDYNVVGVVTVADKPAGRGRQLRTSAVKDYTLSINQEREPQGQITLLQPDRLRSEEFIESLRAINADIFIVVAFRMLPEIVWAMPKLGTFNLHGSLLPDYRGAAPINWAIINGDTKTGVTTFFLNHEIDCGAIIDSRECEINQNDNVETLHDKLMELGATLVVDTVEQIAQGNIETTNQNNIAQNNLRPAPKLFKETMELVVGSESRAKELYNKVRGLSPYPAAWCVISSAQGLDGAIKESITAKVFRCQYEIVDHGLPCGQWQTDSKSYLRVSASDGWLYIEELQPQNKKRMAILDFLRGWR